MPTGRPNLTYSAPIGSVDLAVEDDDGNPFPIWPCLDCLPWHAEVIRDDDGDVLLREWHAVDCPTLRDLLGEPQREP